MAPPKEDKRHKREERRGKSWKVSHLATMNSSFFPSRWYWKNMESSKQRREEEKVWRSQCYHYWEIICHDIGWWWLWWAWNLKHFSPSSRSYRGENDYTLNIFGEKMGMNLWNWDSFRKVFIKFHSNGEKLPLKKKVQAKKINVKYMDILCSQTSDSNVEAKLRKSLNF